MLDCLIVGAGPAGTIAALVLARAGARVCLVDRAAFPRDKLCGDTVNPGTLALLRRLGLASDVESRGLPVAGMRVTGADGTIVEGRYPPLLSGRAMRRRELDALLVTRAVAAGCEFEPQVAVSGAEIDYTGQHPKVIGVRVGPERSARVLRARVIIAADGRRSTLAFGLGLARHADRPRRWAIGAYFETDANAFALQSASNQTSHPVLVGPQSACARTSLGLRSECDANEGPSRLRPGSVPGPCRVRAGSVPLARLHRGDAHPAGALHWRRVRPGGIDECVPREAIVSR